jgi:predicted transcriptional regulator of viral defense system
MDKEYELFQIAESQQGYFTSRQAKECGFFPANFHRKVQQRKWIKEAPWGIYRLANYPYTPHSELAMWTLWSANKKGTPQGVWSHETALELHNLSDVAPAKLHLSVPRGFRKGTKIPPNLCLHFVNKLVANDIETHQGFRVTTALRTLADIVQEGTTQPEQIQMAILDLAFQRSLTKGLVTIQEMEKLGQFTKSASLQKLVLRVLNEVRGETDRQLQDLGRLVEPYTIGLIFDKETFGTAILCQYQNHYFFLTASDIGRSLKKASSASLILRFDHLKKEHPISRLKNFTVLEWDTSFGAKMLDNVLGCHPKDLTVIIPSQDVIEMLKIYKDFYKISKKPPRIALDEALVSLGGVESTQQQFTIAPFAFVASQYQHLPKVDYIVCPITRQFEGLSGSGLWKFTNHTPHLVGIAIAQDKASRKKSRNIYFHGPQSIINSLSTLGMMHDS